MATVQTRLPAAAALRPRVPRGRRRLRAAGRRPLRDLRLVRALHRGHHRALRRRLPGLAGAGAGDGHPDRGPAPASTPQQVRDALAAAGLRAEIDDRSERMQAKVRDAQEQKIPVMLVVGDRDAEAGAVSAAAADRRVVAGGAARRPSWRSSPAASSGASCGRTRTRRAHRRPPPAHEEDARGRPAGPGIGRPGPRGRVLRIGLWLQAPRRGRWRRGPGSFVLAADSDGTPSEIDRLVSSQGGEGKHLGVELGHSRAVLTAAFTDTSRADPTAAHPGSVTVRCG